MPTTVPGDKKKSKYPGADSTYLPVQWTKGEETNNRTQVFKCLDRMWDSVINEGQLLTQTCRSEEQNRYPESSL